MSRVVNRRQVGGSGYWTGNDNKPQYLIKPKMPRLQSSLVMIEVGAVAMRRAQQREVLVKRPFFLTAALRGLK